jgi:hypothetical protein
MKYILAFIIPVIIVYLLFAFIQWNINAEYWSDTTRGACVIAAMGLVCFSVTVTIAITEDCSLRR